MSSREDYFRWLVEEDHCGGLAHDTSTTQFLRHPCVQYGFYYLSNTDKGSIAVTHRGAPRIQREEKERALLAILMALFEAESEEFRIHNYILRKESGLLRLIIGKYDAMMDNFTSKLNCEFQFSLTVESWSSPQMDSFRFSIWAGVDIYNESAVFEFGWDIEHKCAFCCSGDYESYDPGNEMEHTDLRREPLAEQKVFFSPKDELVAFLGVVMSYRHQTFQWMTWLGTDNAICFRCELCNRESLFRARI